MVPTIAAAVLAISILVLATMLLGCNRMSVREKDDTAGFNGGFEIERSGLPVNWYFHHPPIKRGDMEVSLDTSDPVEGRQSLKVVVHRVGDEVGWRAPGLFQVTAAEPSRAYRVSFWCKNAGCELSLRLNSEQPKTATESVELVLSAGNTSPDTWKRFELDYTVPEAYDNIRFQLGMSKPGTFWIDDIQIGSLPAD
jgi:hypothetical protein